MYRTHLRFALRLAVALAALCVVAPGHCAAQAVSTILPATITNGTLPPGTACKITFHWKAAPTSVDRTIFLHFVDTRGQVAFQDDQGAPFGTQNWAGPVNYTETVVVPSDAADGTYAVVAGLYGSKSGGGWVNYPLIAGPGVKPLDGNSYEIGSIVVDRAAAKPPLDSDGRATLRLPGYHMTFDEEFKTLDVSTSGPNTRWTAHTPYNGDFGDAAFGNPGPDSPFAIVPEGLRIEAKKEGAKWRAGLLSSVDPKGQGFSQQYGYFEMCAKFPKGPGTWPAFWMCSTRGISDHSKPSPEIDIVEQYGNAPNLLHTTVHFWGPGDRHIAAGQVSCVEDMSEDYHTYGLLWTRANLIWYFDGIEMYRLPTPPAANTPMYIMVNLALGSGWPIDQTPDPSDMLVKYVRVYAKGMH